MSDGAFGGTCLTVNEELLAENQYIVTPDTVHVSVHGCYWQTLHLTHGGVTPDRRPIVQINPSVHLKTIAPNARVVWLLDGKYKPPAFTAHWHMDKYS